MNKPDFSLLESFLKKHLGISFEDPEFQKVMAIFIDLQSEGKQAIRTIEKIVDTKIDEPELRDAYKLALYQDTLKNIADEKQMTYVSLVYAAQQLKKAQLEIDLLKAKLRLAEAKLNRTINSTKETGEYRH